ncbi:MAG: FAD-dependent oxidoreductase [Acidobacteriota bacterium]|nr:FAD-dependent oxidoreductase [Acidobacteriota bacterium]
MPNFEYDLVVIGGGAAGLTAAGFGALMGAKTALIEAERLGGDCTWTGCIPSKTLLKAAKVAHQIRTADRYGLNPGTPEFDFSKLLEHIHKVQEGIYEHADAPPNMQRLGVEVISGSARFLDSRTVETGSRKLSARFVVIATGSRAAVPKIPGLAAGDYITNETVFSLSRQPRKLAVLGGGPIGIEMAQAFQRLGSEVTVINKEAQILPRDDRELTALLQSSLEQEGVQFVPKSQLTKVQRSGEVLNLQLSTEGSPPSTLQADTLFVATGRDVHTTGLNLEAARVEHSASGIPVNRRCQTNVKHIYACGDVAVPPSGKLQFTHMAEHMAKVAINNAILHLPVTLDERNVPWCTFTDPELAHVGWGTHELDKRRLSYETYRLPFARIDRAVTEGETGGMIKVFANKRGKIYGASLLGAHAGELAGEYSLAIRNGISLKAIASTVHAYPTLALGNRMAADQWLMRKRTPGRVRWIQRIFGYRGPVVDSPE